MVVVESVEGREGEREAQVTCDTICEGANPHLQPWSSPKTLHFNLCLCALHVKHGDQVLSVLNPSDSSDSWWWLETLWAHIFLPVISFNTPVGKPLTL